MVDFIAASGDFPPVFILLAVVLSSVVIVSLILSKFKQSLLVGYFLCGVILANSGILEKIGISDISAIGALSEIGIVLLLFTIGIEFSISEIKALKRPVLLGGGVQVGLTVILSFLIALACGLSWEHALVLGFGFSLSSTAVSIKTFQDMGLPESPQARVTLGIAIFQDLAAIVFMVLIPAILGDEGGSSLGSAVLKGIAFMIGILVLSRYGIPQMLETVAKVRSRELFTVTVIGMCAAVALISGLLGLSPALGAFAAGVVVSESIYSHRVLSDVLPFKDLFLTVFFVSVGLLLDVSTIAENWISILLMTLAILVLKGAIVGFAARLSGLKSMTGLLTALSLASAGEFSIVLFNKAFSFEILSAQFEQVILASTAISMAFVPSLMKLGLHYSNKVRKPKTAQACREEEAMGMVHQIELMKDHVIICGYGPVGRNLHRNLQKVEIPVLILEMNPDTVKSLLSKGVKALFADARDEVVWELANVHSSRGIAITFPAVEVAQDVCDCVLAIKPDIIIHARCKYEADVEILTKAGVHHVMLDEEQSGRAMIRSVSNSFAFEIDENWE